MQIIVVENKLDTMAYGVCSKSIRELDSNAENFLIVGIIIAQQNARAVISKKDNQERCTWSFTLRDSPLDCINVSVWGNRSYVFELSETFHIADIVEVANPRLLTRRFGDSNENFFPAVSSPFQLNIIENKTTLQLHLSENARQQILPLLRCLTKPSCDFFSLADLQKNGNNKTEECVNLLVAVKKVGTARRIKTKDGREIDCRDCIVFDQTNPGFTLQLWSSELVLRANSWQPRETILFLADVKVAYNNFRRDVAASDGARTIITENPETNESANLRQYARSVPFDGDALVQSLISQIPDPKSIQNVMTVQQMLDRAGSKSNELHFTVLMYCLITKLDLDGCHSIIVYKCSRCNSIAKEATGCAKPECQRMQPNLFPSFDIQVALSDHTGTADKCKLTGVEAEKVLGCSAVNFCRLSLQGKIALKWRFLLERCATRVLVLPPRADRWRPLIVLVACELADPTEVAARIPMH